MFSSKQLSEDQIKALKTWAAEGAQLPELQAKIREEFNFPVTYMDTRFAILDLGIELVQEEAEEEPVIEEEVAAVPVPTGTVTSSVDTIPQPAALVSGTVTFSDGETATWMLDQTGRPSVDPATPGYQPSQEDIMEFQSQLHGHIQSLGL